MQRLERGFVILNGAAVIFGLALMAVVIGWNVGLRWLTNHSLSWADEVARYTMIWLTFLGAGLALRQGAHVAITNLQEALPDRAALMLRWLILLMLLAFCGLMVWVGIDYMNRMAVQKSAALRLPMKWVYAAMPCGFALLVVHLLLMAPRYLRAGFAPADEAVRD